MDERECAMFVVGGESLVDMIPETREPGAIRRPVPGGSPYNCAIALAKLGNETGFLCPISQDEYGDMLLAPLAEAGVHLLLKDRVTEPTTKAIITYREGGQDYAFERGADHAFTREQLLAALPQSLELYQIGGFAPMLAEDAEKWMPVVKSAIGRGATVSFDINVRKVDDEEGYRSRLAQFLDLAHIIKLSEEDHEWLEPGVSIEEHAQWLLDRPNCELVVVTLGEHGSLAFSNVASARAGIYAPPVFGDTVGAGDSLMAGILTWLHETNALKLGKLGQLDSAALEETLRFGAVVAGLNCAQKGCKPPTRAEVDAVLAGA